MRNVFEKDNCKNKDTLLFFLIKILLFYCDGLSSYTNKQTHLTTCEAIGLLNSETIF